MSEKVVMGGGTMNDEIPLTPIIRGLLARLSAATDDVNNRDMDIHIAMTFVLTMGRESRSYRRWYCRPFSYFFFPTTGKRYDHYLRGNNCEQTTSMDASAWSGHVM